MLKEKIVFMDGTEISIEDGATKSLIQVICPTIDDFKETYEKFTDYNLSSYQIKNAEGLTVSNLEEKHVEGVDLKPIDNGFLVSFHLADVDKVKVAVDAAIDAYTEQLIEEGFI